MSLKEYTDYIRAKVEASKNDVDVARAEYIKSKLKFFCKATVRYWAKKGHLECVMIDNTIYIIMNQAAEEWLPYHGKRK